MYNLCMQEHLLRDAKYELHTAIATGEVTQWYVSDTLPPRRPITEEIPLRELLECSVFGEPSEA